MNFFVGVIVAGFVLGFCLAWFVKTLMDFVSKDIGDKLDNELFGRLLLVCMPVGYVTAYYFY